MPLAIRNAPTALMSELGYGRDYIYAPETEAGIGGLECLPDSLRGTRFYRPSGDGFEERLRARLQQLEEVRAQVRRQRGAAGGRDDQGSGGGGK